MSSILTELEVIEQTARKLIINLAKRHVFEETRTTQP